MPAVLRYARKALRFRDSFHISGNYNDESKKARKKERNGYRQTATHDIVGLELGNESTSTNYSKVNLNKKIILFGTNCKSSYIPKIRENSGVYCKKAPEV